MKKEVFVAAGLIFENGKLFATRRGECKYPYVAHKYEFPGGKIEQGESAQVGSLFAVERFEYPDFIINLSVYECERLSDFTLKEHEECAFFSPSELNEADFAPADKEILETIKRVFGE